MATRAIVVTPANLPCRQSPLALHTGYILESFAYICISPDSTPTGIVVKQTQPVPPGDVGGGMRNLGNDALQLNGAASLVVLLRRGRAPLVEDLHVRNCSSNKIIISEMMCKYRKAKPHQLSLGRRAGRAADARTPGTRTDPHPARWQTG